MGAMTFVPLKTYPGLGFTQVRTKRDGTQIIQYVHALTFHIDNHFALCKPVKYLTNKILIKCIKDTAEQIERNEVNRLDGEIVLEYLYEELARRAK